MKRNRYLCAVAAVALVGSGVSAALLPGTLAGAKGVKPAVTVTCTSLFGQEASQSLTGCTSSSSKVNGAYGTQVDSGSTATIYWTTKATTTVTFTYSQPADACPTFLGVAPASEVAESITVTGGNSKLTDEAYPTAQDSCAYSAGGDIVVNSLGSISF
jgi:hypothetical protein